MKRRLLFAALPMAMAMAGMGANAGCGSDSDAPSAPVVSSTVSDAGVGIPVVDGAIGYADVDAANDPVAPEGGDASPSTPDSGPNCDASEVSSDPTNCGACGNVCSATGSNDTAVCVQGACRVLTALATGQTAIGSLALAGATLAWTTGGPSGGVSALALDDLAVPAKTLTASPGDPYALSITTQYAVWLTPTEGLTEYDLLNDIRTTIAPGTDVSATATDGSFIYWTDTATGVVSRVAMDGSGVTTLYSAPLVATAIAIDTSYVYFGNGSNILRVAKTGGAATTIAPAAGSATDLVLGVDATNIYWSSGDVGAPLYAAAKDGSGSPSSVTVPHGGISSLFVDDAALYFGDGQTVVRSAKAPGSVEAPLAPPMNGGPGGIVADSSYVYWASTEAGTLVRTAK